MGGCSGSFHSRQGGLGDQAQHPHPTFWKTLPISLAAPALRNKNKKLLPVPDVSHTNIIPNLDEWAVIQPFPSALDLGMRRNLMPCVTEIPIKSPLGPVPFPLELLWGPG